MTFNCLLCGKEAKDGEEGMFELGLCWDCIERQSLGHPSGDHQAPTAEIYGGLRPGGYTPEGERCLRVLSQGLHPKRKESEA